MLGNVWAKKYNKNKNPLKIKRLTRDFVLEMGLEPIQKFLSTGF